MSDTSGSDVRSALARALRAADAERNRRFSETAALTRLLEEHVSQREKDQEAIKALEAEVLRIKALEAEVLRIKAEKDQQVQAVKAELAAKLRKVKAEKEQRSQPAKAELDAELRMVRTELSDHLREHRARLRSLEKDFQRLRTRYERFYTSRSWRVTAPLRSIRRFLFG